MGAAIGNDLLGTARELNPFKAKDGIPDWHVIEEYISQWQPKAIIVGLPLNMDGTESELSTRARKFGKRIHGRYHLEVIMHDERLSSHEAKGYALQRERGLNFGEQSVDGIAACLILESWFAQRTEQQ